jgi:pyridoxal phosphate enzyme (YggS family)
MINSVNNLISLQDILKTKIKNLKLPKIIAVSKTFPIEDIYPLINHGHEHYGENKVQEAIEKWTVIKDDFSNIKLHMIGKLQTNKVKYAVRLFDYIHSLDSIKLAEKISNEQSKIKKNIKIFIQINIGNEDQKVGIDIDQLESFYNKCTTDLGLNIIGLMCLPPKTNSSLNYFLKMKELLTKINLQELSMGMSSDYLKAAECDSTYLRIGSKIFGERV